MAEPWDGKRKAGHEKDRRREARERKETEEQDEDENAKTRTRSLQGCAQQIAGKGTEGGERQGCLMTENCK